MKIEKIALRNFRSGQNLILDTTAPRIYVCGRNGSGKSSIKDGIRWTLRGVCAGTDAKGLGWEQLMPSNSTVLAAGLTIEGLGDVERAYKDGRRTLQLEGRDNDMASTQQAIYQLLNTRPEVLDAVLETDYFLRLHHADAKAIVLGLLDVKIPIGAEQLTLAQVDARYKVAFGDRAIAKAAAKAHVVPSFQIPPEGQYPPVADIEKRLQELRVELRGVDTTSAQSAGKRQALEEQLRRAEATEVLDPGVAPVEAEIQELRGRIAELEAQAAAALPAPLPKATKPTTNSEIERRIHVLTEHQPKKGCVLDPSVRCDTAKLVFTNRVKAYRAEMDATMPTEPSGTHQEASPATFDRQALAQAREALAGLQALQQAHQKAIEHNGRRASEVDALVAQLKSLPADHGQDASAQVEALQARIAKGEKVLTVAREFWRQKLDSAKAVERKQELDANVLRLEALVEELGPNGARVKALGDAIGAFEAAINVRTQVFGWAVKFELEPWSVMVNGRAIEAYSESEQFRIGIAIQMAVAAVSGLGFLVIDRLDLLDVENRSKVMEMILAPNTGIGQIVVMATREPGQPLPVIPNVKAYRLAAFEGQTTIAEVTT